MGRNGIKATISEGAGSVRQAIVGSADTVVRYVDPLAKDEKLRRRLKAAVVAGAAARQRARRQAGLSGAARRLASDEALRAQLVEMATQLRAAQKRAKKARSRKLRNTILFVGAVGVVIAVVPAAREAVASIVGGSHDAATGEQWTESPASSPASVDEGLDHSA